MNRRTFTKTFGLSVAALGLGGVPALACKRATLYSITMDDFYWTNPVKLTSTQRNEAILGTLRDHSHQAALFVIGGAEVFALCWPIVGRMELTEVHADVEGDTVLEGFERRDWRETARVTHDVDARHAWPFDFVTLVRR